MFLNTIKNIPRSVITNIYEELYNLRINVIVSVASPKLDTYNISFKKKYTTQVTLLVAKYLNGLR